MNNKNKNNPMSKETLTPGEKMEVAQKFKWTKDDEYGEMTQLERATVDLQIHDWRKVYKDVFDKKTKPREEWEKVINEAASMKEEDKILLEARFEEQIKKRNEFFISHVMALEEHPGLERLFGKKEDLKKLLQGFRLDTDEHKLWKEWPLPIKAIKLADQTEDTNRRKEVIQQKVQEYKKSKEEK